MHLSFCKSQMKRAFVEVKRIKLIVVYVTNVRSSILFTFLFSSYISAYGKVHPNRAYVHIPQYNAMTSISFSFSLVSPFSFYEYMWGVIVARVKFEALSRTIPNRVCVSIFVANMTVWRVCFGIWRWICLWTTFMPPPRFDRL